jgi:hypothetical protein
LSYDATDEVAPTGRWDDDSGDLVEPEGRPA